VKTIHLSIIQTKLQLKNVVFFLFSLIILCLSYGCNQKDNSLNKANSKMLDAIEAQMFQYPEILDSLLCNIDTTNITQHDEARVNMIRGYIYYRNGEYDNGINELEKGETFFLNEKDYYHQNINNLIEAFTFEQLKLNDNAAKLYIECKKYFEKNQYPKYTFYAELGLLRMSNQLILEKIELINDLKRMLIEFHDPIFDALFYSAMGNLETDDSLKCDYYEKARSEFILAKRWSRVYTLEINTLFAKIRQDQSEKIQVYYNNFPNKLYFYIPTVYQRMRYKYGQAYLFALQGKNKEAIEVANKLLNELVVLKFPAIESDCANLLSVLYMRTGDYKNAYYMLIKDNELKEKSLKDLQQNRLVALGGYYRYSELEKDKLNLKVENQNYLLLLSVIVLIIIIGIFIGWFLLKNAKHKQEILKLKNIEIEDQFNNLLHALENSENKNALLITQVEESKVQYKDSLDISKFLESIDKNQITKWPEYETAFMKLRPGWLEKIKQQVPALTPSDIKYCMCIYFNFENAIIRSLLNVSLDAIKSAKKRIRDKFLLEHSSQIYTFLKKFD